MSISITDYWFDMFSVVACVSVCRIDLRWCFSVWLFASVVVVVKTAVNHNRVTSLSIRQMRVDIDVIRHNSCCSLYRVFDSQQFVLMRVVFPEWSLADVSFVQATWLQLFGLWSKGSLLHVNMSPASVPVNWSLFALSGWCARPGAGPSLGDSLAFCVLML